MRAAVLQRGRCRRRGHVASRWAALLRLEPHPRQRTVDRSPGPRRSRRRRSIGPRRQKLRRTPRPPTQNASISGAAISGRPRSSSRDVRMFVDFLRRVGRSRERMLTAVGIGRDRTSDQYDKRSHVEHVRGRRARKKRMRFPPDSARRVTRADRDRGPAHFAAPRPKIRAREFRDARHVPGFAD
jgi:hypothetical protein